MILIFNKKLNRRKEIIKIPQKYGEKTYNCSKN